MSDDNAFSTDYDNEQALNAALVEVDRALARFDEIVQKRLRFVAGQSGVRLSGIIPQQLQRRNPVFRAGIRGLQDMIDFGDRPQGTVFNPNARNSGNGNGFPASNGQWLSDLAAMIGRMQSRNL